MSGLDNLIKGVTGGGGGGLGSILGSLTGGGGGLAGALVPMVGGLLAGGGLQKLLSGFHANGLSAQADSWVGHGENQPIGGDDVRKVVGADELSQIATKLGVSEDEAAAAVAQALPAVVDHVTPAGTVPPAEEVDKALGALQPVGSATPAA